MAIAFDAAVSEQLGISVTSLTWSHTVTGTDPLLFVSVYSNQTLSSITYNGVAMTLKTSVTAVSGNFNGFTLFLYYALAPATGAHNVVVTLSASGVVRGASASYSGVKTVDQHASSNSSGQQTSYSLAVTGTRNNTWTIGSFSNGAGNGVAGTATTMRTATGFMDIFDSNTNQATPATVTLAATSSLQDWFGVAMDVSADLPASGRMFAVF